VTPAVGPQEIETLEALLRKILAGLELPD